MKFLSNVLFTLFLLLCAVVVTFTGLSVAKVITPFVVISGSMEPGIKTGSLMLSVQQKTSEMNVGQVVSLQRDDQVWVTHRIVGISNLPNDPTGDTKVITMKGDANKTDDTQPYIQESGLRPVVIVPEVGTIYAGIENHKKAIMAVAFFFIAGVIYMKFLSRKARGNASIDSEDEDVNNANIDDQGSDKNTTDPGAANDGNESDDSKKGTSVNEVNNAGSSD